MIKRIDNNRREIAIQGSGQDVEPIASIHIAIILLG